MARTDQPAPFATYWGLSACSKKGDGAFKPTPRIKDLVLEHFLKAAVKEEQDKEHAEDYR